VPGETIDPNARLGTPDNPTPGPKAYATALRRIELTNTQIRMLRAHFAAPGHTISMLEMSRIVFDRNRPGAANMQYGLLGAAIAEALELRIPKSHPRLCAIGLFRQKDARGHWPLAMHASLAEVLVELDLIQ
jgi:hypothetical protein